MGNRSGARFTNQHKGMLARIDGNYCLICANFGQGARVIRAPPEWPLQVHHGRTDLKESDPRRWGYDVTCLACEPCNLSLRNKTPKELCQIIRLCRLRNEREREKESESGRDLVRSSGIGDSIDGFQGSSESAAKSLYLPRFKKFLIDRVIEYGKFPIEELLDQFFDLSECAQVTSRRYLRGWSSDTGIYRRFKEDGIWYVAFRYDRKALKGSRGGARKQGKKANVNSTNPTGKKEGK